VRVIGVRLSPGVCGMYYMRWDGPLGAFCRAKLSAKVFVGRWNNKVRSRSESSK